MRPFAINGHPIGDGHSVYVVAELSANHDQSLDVAKDIVRAAGDAGADAIKLQTYTPDTLTIRSDRPEFRIGGGTAWDGRTLYDLYHEAQTPWEWHAPLQALAAEIGLDFFSTPFDETAVNFLEDLDVPAFKIASFECVDLPLIRRIARTGRPTIMSTGMASLEEIREAVDTFRQAGGRELALLKCTSAYPAPPQEMHLRTIPDLAEQFDLPVGLSDHSMGIAVPVAAVVLGASIIEKHLTLARSVPGPDSAFSLEPEEFAAMVRAVRESRSALGGISYGASAHEEASRVFRRSLFIVRDTKAGERLTPAHVQSIRPGYGLHTRHLQEVLGRKAARDIERGTPLNWDLILPDNEGQRTGAVGSSVQ